MEESLLKDPNQSDFMLLDIFNNERLVSSPQQKANIISSADNENEKGGTANFGENCDDHMGKKTK